MSNPTVILNGDQVYCDELIRENARLTIQHEADRLTLEQMRKQGVSSEECTAKVAEAYARADKAKRDAEALAPSRCGPAFCHGWRRCLQGVRRQVCFWRGQLQTRVAWRGWC